MIPERPLNGKGRLSAPPSDLLRCAGRIAVVAVALIAAGASVTGSVLAYILGIRSLRRSVSSSDGVPIGRYVESRLGGFERRLEGMEHSLTELLDEAVPGNHLTSSAGDGLPVHRGMPYKCVTPPPTIHAEGIAAVEARFAKATL